MTKFLVEIDTTMTKEELKDLLRSKWIMQVNDPSYRGFGWKPRIKSWKVKKKMRKPIGLMKKNFKDILKETPKPKILQMDEKLPYVFDLHWDCKTLRSIVNFNLINNEHVLRELAQHGYDVDELKLRFKDKNE